MSRAIPALKLLQIDVTEECPLFCVHCSNSSGPIRRIHFPIERLIHLLGEAKALGAERVIYSGGEPLRYPDLAAAISAAALLNLQTAIFTTGIEDTVSRLEISEKRWSDLKSRGLGIAVFSIYSAPTNRKFHNRVVRCEPLDGDAFGVNERAIRHAKLGGLSTELHFVPFGETVDDLPEIYSWARSLGCSTLHLQVPTYQGRNAGPDSLALSYEQELRLRGAARDLKIEAGTTFYISRFWRCRWNGDSDSARLAVEQLIVRTDGMIAPSNACKYAPGDCGLASVLTPGVSLHTLWESSQTLADFRDAGGANTISIRCEEALAVTPKRAANTA